MIIQFCFVTVNLQTLYILSPGIALIMLKITDKDYFLPIIEALYGIKSYDTGTTQPMQIAGVCTKTGVKDTYVVKYLNSPRMSIKASTSELVAAFIARQLDLHVVEPAIINVSELFVDTLRGKDGFKFASNSIGLNYGCKYVPGYFEFVRNQELNDAQFAAAEHIFAFDVFISNPDRGPQGKQNMLTNGKKILIFDHELAFSFLYDIFVKNPTPWLIGENDRAVIQKHFFYHTLKEKDHKFDEFVERLTIIDETFWERVTSLIPPEWQSDQINEIKTNLASLIEHRSIFLQELYKVLS